MTTPRPHDLATEDDPFGPLERDTTRPPSAWLHTYKYAPVALTKGQPVDVCDPGSRLVAGGDAVGPASNLAEPMGWMYEAVDAGGWGWVKVRVWRELWALLPAGLIAAVRSGDTCALEVARDYLRDRDALVCEWCDSIDDIRPGGVRTRYHGEEPQPNPWLCEPCRDERDEHWADMWSNVP